MNYEQEVRNRILENKDTPRVLKAMGFLYGLNKAKAINLLVKRVVEQGEERGLGILKRSFTYWFCWDDTEEGDTYWRHVDHIYRIPYGAIPLDDLV